MDSASRPTSGAKGEVRLFSRTAGRDQCPVPRARRTALPLAVREVPAILEGECVPIDPDTDEIRPFQEVSRRRGRKHDLDRLQQEVPVCLFLFDVLLSDGKVVYDRPFPERRRLLEQMLRPSERVRVADQRLVHSVDEATAFFDEALAGGGEGIVAKSLQEGSGYRAGARGFWWIKYKRDYTAGLSDSIDGVVVGGFHGRGRRAGRFGAYLLAVYNPRPGPFRILLQGGERVRRCGAGRDAQTTSELPRF